MKEKQPHYNANVDSRLVILILNEMYEQNKQQSRNTFADTL